MLIFLPAVYRALIKSALSTTKSLALLPYLKRGCSCLEMNEGLKTGEHSVPHGTGRLISH